MVDIPGVPTIAPANPMLEAYKNPYTKDVIDSTVGQIQDAGTKRRNQLGTEAFSAGAYGDARHGVADASLTKDIAKTVADYTGAANAQNFESSMGWLNTDIDRQTNTAFNNASLDNQWLQNQLQLMGLGDQFGRGALTDAQGQSDALLGLDTYDKGVEQQDLNIKYEDFLAQMGYDQNQINAFLASIGGVPGGSTSTTSSPDTSWANMIGAALSGLGTGGSNPGLFR